MDVITFGETMVLFSAPQILPLEYVHQFTKQIGGAESNVAIGLAKQGHQVGWFSKLGRDPFGAYIQKAIRAEGIDTSRCITTSEAPTGIFFKEKKSAESVHVYYYRKGSAASHLRPEDLDEDYIAQAKILHLTGITPALSPSACDTVFRAIEIAEQHGVKISFDPNLRLKLWGEAEARPVLMEIIKHCDYVLPGIEEGEFLTGETKPKAIAESLHKYGAGSVIVKCGPEGAFYSDGCGSGFVHGFKVKNVVDPVGAGDGFASGFLSGIIRGESLDEAVKRGNAVGAFVVQVDGDIEGLPTREELDNMVIGRRESVDVKR